MHGESAPDHPDGRIAALASAQHGVVGAAQLRAVGLTRGQIEHRLRVGRLHRAGRGVYVAGHAALTREGRWMAAVLACGSGAALSHRTAGAHWGLRRSAPECIDVTLPGRTGRKPRRGVRVHRIGSLSATELTVHDGIPVTTVARTLVDLAAALPRPALERCVEEAERLRLFDLAAIDALRERHPRHPGRTVLAAVLDDYRSEHGWTRSMLERRFLALCSDHGFDSPAVNNNVGEFEVDFLWEARRLIVECDGRDTHGTSAAFERDRARDAWLTAGGYRVVRFTWRRVVHRPEEVARLLGRLLRAVP